MEYVTSLVFGTAEAPAWIMILNFFAMLLVIMCAMFWRNPPAWVAFSVAVLGMLFLALAPLARLHNSRFSECRDIPSAITHKGRVMQATVTECRTKDDLRDGWSIWAETNIIPKMVDK